MCVWFSYLANGPMVDGIRPMEANERLNKFRMAFLKLEAQHEHLRLGEGLFGLGTLVSFFLSFFFFFFLLV